MNVVQFKQREKAAPRKLRMTPYQDGHKIRYNVWYPNGHLAAKGMTKRTAERFMEVLGV